MAERAEQQIACNFVQFRARKIWISLFLFQSNNRIENANFFRTLQLISNVSVKNRFCVEKVHLSKNWLSLVVLVIRDLKSSKKENTEITCEQKLFHKKFIKLCMKTANPILIIVKNWSFVKPQKDLAWALLWIKNLSQWFGFKLSNFCLWGRIWGST